MTSYAKIAAAFAADGLSLRGGFTPAEDDAVPPVAAGAPTRTVLLIGNNGTALWSHFARGRRDEPNPLDQWVRRIVEPVAARLGARAVYPSDKPFQPFQRWAMRAEAVHTSPLGILIHPEFGLWHAYRAALLLGEAVPGMPVRRDHPAPCETCDGRPCLSACPVEAFSQAGFDAVACAGHLNSEQAPRCLEMGCRARDACPVGTAHRYPDAQVEFHMQAFHVSRRR